MISTISFQGIKGNEWTLLGPVSDMTRLCGNLLALKVLLTSDDFTSDDFNSSEQSRAKYPIMSTQTDQEILSKI